MKKEDFEEAKNIESKISNLKSRMRKFEKALQSEPLGICVEYKETPRFGTEKISLTTVNFFDIQTLIQNEIKKIEVEVEELQSKFDSL